MPARKTARNARIVRLRGIWGDGFGKHGRTARLSWAEIARMVSREFPEYDDDGKLLVIKRQRAQKIYKTETK